MAKEKIINIATNKKGMTVKTLSTGTDKTTLNFTDLKKPNDLSYTRNKKDLSIKNTDGSINITIKNYFIDASNKGTKSGLATLKFTNGSIDLTSLSIVTNGTSYFVDKKKTLYATAGADNINMETLGATKFYASFGHDTITASVNNDIIYTQYGTNTINFTGNFGKDQLYTGTGIDTIVLDSYSGYEISKNKKNLILKKDENNYVEIMNYMAQGSEGTINVKVNNTTKELNTFIGTKDVNVNKGTAKGSYFNENIYGSDGNDKLYGVGGTNTLYGYNGNDSYYGGTGKDTFVIQGGKNTIYDSTNLDLLYLNNGYSLGNYTGTINGNDLILNEDSGNKYKTTIKNYLKQSLDERINNVKYYDKAHSQFVETTLRNSAFIRFDTTKNLTIDLEWNYVDLYIKNDDYYRFEKSDNDLIMYIGSYNKKGIYSKKSTTTIKNYFNDNGSVKLRPIQLVEPYYDSYNINNIETLLTKEVAGNTCSLCQRTTKTKTELKGYVNYENTIVGSNRNETYTAVNTERGNFVDLKGGNDTVEITDIDSSYTTYLYSSGSDKYYAKGTSSNDWYSVGTSMDYMTAKILHPGFGANSSLYIKDYGGNNDILDITSKSQNLALFFNVNKSGNIVVSGNLAFSQSSDGTAFDSLMIFNKNSLTGKNISNMNKKGNLTGAIEIDDYFKSDGSSGSGYMEKIREYNSSKDNFYKMDMTTWIDSVKADVGAWLSDTSQHSTSYNTALDVINGGNQTDINNLIKVYAGATYSQK